MLSPERQSARMSKITNERLNPVWYGMLYSCTHMATVGVKGLTQTSRCPPYCNCSCLFVITVYIKNLLFLGICLTLRIKYRCIFLFAVAYFLYCMSLAWVAFCPLLNNRISYFLNSTSSSINHKQWPPSSPEIHFISICWVHCFRHFANFTV